MLKSMNIHFKGLSGILFSFSKDQHMKKYQHYIDARGEVLQITYKQRQPLQS